MARVESISSMVRHTGDLTELCQDLFASFARSDQRRWGEVYVRGLASLGGRKSIRRISDHVVGWRADQSLQQFVNQSPWRWEPVRQALAQQASNLLRPHALAIEEITFPKNGNSSVGVAKQFVPGYQRIVNCQLAFAAFLVGDEGAIPVNWRLQLPKCWDTDQRRRSHAKVPGHERHRPRFAYVIDLLDELMDWGVLPAPVLIDARGEHNVEALLHALEERDLPYVARVAEQTPVAVPQQAGSAAPATTTAIEALRQARRLGRLTMNWRDTVEGRSVTSQFAFAAIRGPRHTSGLTSLRPYRSTRRALAEWVSNQLQPDAVYLTNITQVRMPELVHLVRTRGRFGEDLVRLREECGLTDFEGRSFTGWHHHVTLASIAHAHRTAQRCRQSELADQWARPYA